MHHVPAAIHASASTPTMVVSASHACQEQSQTQQPQQPTALVAVNEDMVSSRQWELPARNAHREDSQTKLEVPASTAQQASTAMGVGVSLVLLDRSRMTIRVAAICVWHSARTSTATTEWNASAVMWAVSPSPIALDASHALLSATRTYQRQAKHACSVARAVSPLLI